MIDTLRADHLGCYGYARPTTPNIDELAARATLFENAVAQSSWTLPSVASFHTGLYPTRHQAINVESALPPWRRTLAEILREDGYRTGAVVSNTLVSSRYGLHQGFDDFDESRLGGYMEVSSAEVSDEAIRWLQKNRDAPFFLFLHYFDPHYAYLEHEGHEFGDPYDGWLEPDFRMERIRSTLWRVKPEDLAHLRDRYDSDVAFTDHHIGRVLRELDKLGLDRTTLVLLTSDHGEEFMEHGWLGHTRDLYEEIVHVPLILRSPVLPELPARFSGLVELIDVMPTLIDLLGVEWDGSGIDGRSFLGSLLGEAHTDTLAFSDLCMIPLHKQEELVSTFKQEGVEYNNVRSLRDGPWKLVYKFSSQRAEIYDLRSDPGEKTSLIGTDEGAPALQMEQQLLSWLDAMETVALAEQAMADSVVLDAETEERLRSLGYIQ
jgi:arylsulfatase A-like enzyme